MVFKRLQISSNNVARYNVGRRYQDGDVVEKDEAKARELFRSSTEGVNLLANSRNGGNNRESETEFYQRMARLETKVGQIYLYKVAEEYKGGKGILRDLRNLLDHTI